MNDSIPESSTDSLCLAMRAHWLRTGALTRRWVEERRILEEEMKRTIRFMEKFRIDWESKGAEWKKGGDRGRAAYAAK